MDRMLRELVALSQDGYDISLAYAANSYEPTKQEGELRYRDSYGACCPRHPGYAGLRAGPRADAYPR